MLSDLLKQKRTVRPRFNAELTYNEQTLWTQPAISKGWLSSRLFYMNKELGCNEFPLIWTHFQTADEFIVNLLGYNEHCISIQKCHHAAPG